MEVVDSSLTVSTAMRRRPGDFTHIHCQADEPSMVGVSDSPLMHERVWNGFSNQLMSVSPPSLTIV